MKIVLLDRDGVINKFPGDGNYVTRVSEFHFIPGALKAIRTLTESGFTIFVISNQAGVTKGLFSERKLKQITRHMLEHVRKAKGKIKEVFYCIHTPELGCGCRKPETGSIQRAFQSVKKPLKEAKDAFFVGDTGSDILAGHKAGCRTIFVLSGRGTRQKIRKWSVKPDFIVRNLLEATKVIQNESARHSRLRRRRTSKGRRSRL